MTAASCGAIYDQTDDFEPAVFTWQVNIPIPERIQLGHGLVHDDEAVLSRHEEAVALRARRAGWRMAVRPAAAARTVAAGLEAGLGVDALADRRATLARRLARGCAWAAALRDGATAAEIAEREGVSDPWVRMEVLLTRLDAPIVAELLKPGSLAAALSNEALREVARRRSAEAQRALFWPLVQQIQAEAAAGRVTAPPARSGGKASFAFLLARARRWQARLEAGETPATIAASEALTRQVVWMWSRVLSLPAEVLQALEQAEDLPGVTLVKLVALAKVHGAEAQVAAFWDLARAAEQRATA